MRICGYKGTRRLKQESWLGEQFQGGLCLLLEDNTSSIISYGNWKINTQFKLNTGLRMVFYLYSFPDE